MVEVKEVSALPSDGVTAPIDISEEDHGKIAEIRANVDSLSHIRQEMGRLYQIIGNLREKANETEVKLTASRKALVEKYGITDSAAGQWSIDFEERQFVRLAGNVPVIP